MSFPLKAINPLIGIKTPYSSGDWYTLAVDGWTVTCGTARRDLGGLQPRPCRSLFAVPNVTGHPSTASVPTLYYSMWHSERLRY